MELRFFGATRGVTGSCHMVRANGHAVLLDCGLFQGRRKEAHERNARFHFDVKEVDAVVQSHAHIDHSGKLPMLRKIGFRGSIHATRGTTELCEIMLLDCAHILKKDAEFLNRRRRRNRKGGKGKNGEVVPLYAAEDVRETLERFESHAYGKWFSAAKGMRFRFHDAGHILGSAWVEGEIEEDGRTQRLVFTGDYGRAGLPILRDPEPLVAADHYISESTYGNRKHPDFAGMESELGAAVSRLAARGRGRLLIPAFAVGRTQNILYTLGSIFETRQAPRVEVVVDSPLATAATRVVQRHAEVFDEEARERLVRSGDGTVEFCPGVRFTESVEESKALNRHPGPVIVISASGMMESGRILHHLANHIESPDTEILIVGFMAESTLGRRLVEGAEEVNVLRERYRVAARVQSMLGFSAHADREGLLQALSPHAEKARTLFLVHGEDDQRVPLAAELGRRGFRRIEEPVERQAFQL